jgi:hypothetical protein
VLANERAKRNLALKLAKPKRAGRIKLPKFSNDSVVNRDIGA